MRKSGFAALLMLVISFPVLAQPEVCSALVQEALSITDSACGATEGNHACYGNVQIEVTPAEAAGDFEFDAPGDQAALTEINALRLSSMVIPDEWGMALLKVRANVPGSLPGQIITMLMFGDAEIENQADIQAPSIEVEANSGVNLRSGPGTSYAVAGGLQAGDIAQAEGRNEAGDWLLIRRADKSSAWVFADLITATGAVANLPVIEAGARSGGSRFGSMQAFSFQSGIGEPICAELPRDGLLIQTPAGAGEIELLINEVTVNINSTIYVTAVPGDVMTIQVVEGLVAVTALGVTISIPAGAQAIIPLDANGIAAGPPTLEGYDEAEPNFAALTGPIDILPEAVEIAPGLDTDGVLPLSGRWVFGAYEDSCTGQAFPPGEVILTVLEEGRTIEVDGPDTLLLMRFEDGLYVFEEETSLFVLAVQTPVQVLAGERYIRNGDNCRQEVTMTWAGPA